MPCLTDTHGASVRYSFGYFAEGPAISGLTIGNLSAARCDGLPVTVILRGNLAGDPTAPPSETLTTLNSKTDPCGQTILAKPTVVRDGTITLAACHAGGRARFASLQYVTQVIVKVRGRTVETLGPPRSSTESPMTELPFTGSWAAATFWIGLASVIGGVFLLGAGRRRSWRLN
jgi:hypothetical protein